MFYSSLGCNVSCQMSFDHGFHSLDTHSPVNKTLCFLKNTPFLYFISSCSLLFIITTLLIMAESQLPGLPGFDKHNIQPWTVEVVVSMTVLALVSCGLRLYSRHLKAQKLWWDDYVILFSMVGTLTVCYARCNRV